MSNYKPSSLLSQVLNDQETWDQFCEAFDEFLEENVNGYIHQLAEIRDIKPETDDVFKKQALRMLGFSLDDSVLDRFDSTDLFVFLQDFPRYAERSGTDALALMLGRILKSNVQMNNLWTNDYVNFLQALPVGEKTVEEGGHWFLSTHVDVTFDWTSLEALTPSDGMSLPKRIYDIFYQLAPINLVLRSVGNDAEFNVDIGLRASLSGQVAIQHI